MKPDLQAIGSHYQSLFGMAGWTITFAWHPVAKMPIKDALACCMSKPTRSLADVLVCDPWPAGESLEETIAHELAHALISPLTSLIETTDASVMIEEQIVERLGIAVVRAAPSSVDMRAMGRAMASLPRQLRARVSALATRRRIGENRMDAKAVLAAITGQDEAAALAILEQWAAEQLGAVSDGGSTDELPAAKEPGADALEGGAAMPREEKEEPAAAYRQGSKARQGASPTELRARRAADSLSTMATRARLREVRAEGLNIDAATEKELLAKLDVDEVEKAIRYMKIGQGTQQRARSGSTPSSAPNRAGSEQAGAVSDDKLRAEGLGEGWINMYREAHARDPHEAAALYDGVRARSAGNHNAWARPGKTS